MAEQWENVDFYGRLRNPNTRCTKLNADKQCRPGAVGCVWRPTVCARRPNRNVKREVCSRFSQDRAGCEGQGACYFRDQSCAAHAYEVTRPIVSGERDAFVEHFFQKKGGLSDLPAGLASFDRFDWRSRAGDAKSRKRKRFISANTLAGGPRAAESPLAAASFQSPSEPQPAPPPARLPPRGLVSVEAANIEPFPRLYAAFDNAFGLGTKSNNAEWEGGSAGNVPRIVRESSQKALLSALTSAFRGDPRVMETLGRAGMGQTGRIKSFVAGLSTADPDIYDAVIAELPSPRSRSPSPNRAPPRQQAPVTTPPVPQLLTSPATSVTPQLGANRTPVAEGPRRGSRSRSLTAKAAAAASPSVSPSPTRRSTRLASSPRRFAPRATAES